MIFSVKWVYKWSIVRSYIKQKVSDGDLVGTIQVATFLFDFLSCIFFIIISFWLEKMLQEQAELYLKTAYEITESE